jgi:hypothetical protein
MHIYRSQALSSCALLVFTLTISQLLIGCALYQVEVDVVDDSAFNRAPTLAITPPVFWMSHRPHHVYQYTQDIIQILTDEGKLATIAPWEYDPTGEFSNMGFRQPLLSALTEHSPVSVRDLALIDLHIQESMADRSFRTSAAMGGSVHHQHESNVTITMTLRSFPEDDPLIDITLSFEEETYPSGATPANPRPHLREAIKETCRLFLIEIQKLWPQEQEQPLPDIDYFYNPRQMFTYQEGTGLPLENDFSDLDELDRLAHIIDYYHYFNPEMNTRTIQRFEQMPSGLLVTQVHEPTWQATLLEGDLITEINGRTVWGPQTFLLPFLQRSRPVSSINVTVLRNEEHEALYLPISSSID